MNGRHVLGLSGGKDSAALAVYMQEQYPEIPMEYFFADTGEELPEVYSFLGRLEAYLGREIVRLNSGRPFKYWLETFNNFLPSQQARWCTVKMKLEPFKEWIRADLERGLTIHSYVAIRCDEDSRSGMLTNAHNLRVVMPFRTDGVDKAGVYAILERSGLGLPEYYSWRSRSGCTFCFFQQKIEWVRLMERYPIAFREAAELEKTALEGGSPFTWSQGESLEQLARPERVAQIKEDFSRRQQLLREKRRANPLHEGLSDDEVQDIDAAYGCPEGAGSCAFCMK